MGVVGTSSLARARARARVGGGAGVVGVVGVVVAVFLVSCPGSGVAAGDETEVS